MQQLLEQARQKDEKIRALETAVINQPALGGSPSPTPPITPPQRPSQSSNDSASQDEVVEDQASSQNSFNSGFSPGGSQQDFSPAGSQQEGPADVWGGWGGIDFGAQATSEPIAQAADNRANNRALPDAPPASPARPSGPKPLAKDLRGEVLWFGGDGINYGFIGVSSTETKSGPAAKYFMHKNDVEASGLTIAQVSEGQKLLFDVQERNPLDEEVSPEAVLKYAKDHRDAWIEWLRGAQLPPSPSQLFPSSQQLDC